MEELDNNKLIGCIDAQIWVNHWMKTIKKNPKIPTDEGAMLAWFANAIMSGYDKGMIHANEDKVEEDE